MFINSNSLCGSIGEHGFAQNSSIQEGDVVLIAKLSIILCFVTLCTAGNSTA